jgi:hypothetical protein
MKIIKILAGLLLVANLAMAATNVEVHINYPSDSVFIGSYNKLEIWIENTDTIIGISLGFECTGSLATLYWDEDYGSVPPVNIENDARFAINWQNLYYGFGDTELPDSFLVGGVFVPPITPGILPGASRECISLYFYVPESESPGEFCIDNVFIPPGGDWIVDDGSPDIAPSFQGCAETVSPYTNCPAVCFPVANTERPCGDANGDLFTNFADVVYIIEYMLHTSGPLGYAFADVNCDGRVNIADAEFLAEYIFTGGPAPGAGCP